MPDVDTFTELVMALPDVTSKPHFHRLAFRTNGKIFATLDKQSGVAVMLFSPEEQDLFSLHDPVTIYPVPNKWGKKGATEIVLKTVRKQVLKEALKTAWERAWKK